MRRKVILGVIGGGSVSATTYQLAEQLGRHIAHSDALLLCGGRGGVMEAAAKGAKAEGGATIGILPEFSETPNTSIECAIRTGLGDSRNYVNVCAADALIALSGAAGTLSEIALCLRVSRPLVFLGAWQFLNEAGFGPVPYVDDPQQAVVEALRRIPNLENGCMDGEINYPDLPAQNEQKAAFENYVRQQSVRC